MIKLIPLIVLTITTVFSNAQTVVTGKIKDNKGRPVPGASIAVKDSYDGGTSDSTGSYRFRTSEKGPQILLFTSIGFKLIEEKVNLDGGTVTVNVTLKEEPNELTAVVISVGTFEASDRKRAAAILDPIDIVTTASANGDITGALKTLPGAQTVGESEGLFVRGGTAAETKTFIDGTLVNNFFFSSAPNIASFSRFSPFIFKGTVFSTGGYSALYGQALSSALILESIDLPEQSSANFGVSVLSVSGGYQKLAKNKKSSFGVSYNYANLGPAFKVIKQQQDYTTAPETHSADANFRIKTSKTGIIKYYGYLNTSDVDFMTNSLDTLNYKDRFGLKNFNTYHNFSYRETIAKKWKMYSGVSFSINRDDIKSNLRDQAEKDVLLSGLEFKNFTVDNNGDFFNARLVLERKLKGLSALRFGGEYNYSHEYSDYTDFNNQTYRATVTENIKSAFAEADVYVTNNIAAKLGGRLEHSAILDKVNVAPRISLAYKFSRQAQASLAYGIFYQNPERRYLPSSADLTFSKATHYIAQFMKVDGLTTFRTEVFYKKYDELVKTSFLNGREAAVNNKGYGDAKGIEFFWRDKKNIKNLDYWISYSYLDTKRDFLNFPTAIEPNFAAKHTASLIVKKFVQKLKMNLNGSYNFASGRPYYNIGYDGTNYKFNDRGRTPEYHNVSFSVNYLPFIGKKNAKVFDVYVLQVSNIFNIKQTYGYQYSFNGLRKQAIVPPSRMFVFIGAFFSFGVDRSDEIINSAL
jgi:vitamin B12 transporter